MRGYVYSIEIRKLYSLYHGIQVIYSDYYIIIVVYNYLNDVLRQKLLHDARHPYFARNRVFDGSAGLRMRFGETRMNGVSDKKEERIIIRPWGNCGCMKKGGY